LIINATKERIEINFVLPLSLGNPQPGIHRNKLNPPGGIGKRVNTPTLTYGCTHKGKKRPGTLPTSLVSSIKRDAVYLNKK
jgi:hypothetical protein